MLTVKELFVRILKTIFVFLCIIIFPLGLFMLGYVIGRHYGRKDINFQNSLDDIDEKNLMKKKDIQIINENNELEV